MLYYNTGWILFPYFKKHGMCIFSDYICQNRHTPIKPTICPPSKMCKNADKSPKMQGFCRGDWPPAFRAVRKIDWNRNGSGWVFFIRERRVSGIGPKNILRPASASKRQELSTACPGGALASPGTRMSLAKLQSQPQREQMVAAFHSCCECHKRPEVDREAATAPHVLG